MRNDDHRRRLYEQCVEEHSASLFRVAFRLTGSPDRANELVQETFLCAWKDLPKLKDESKIRGWMFSILRNQNSKLFRKRFRENELTDSMLENLAEQPAGREPDFQRQFQEAVGRLDEDHKLPLLLVAMEGLSVDVAAETLGIPRGTVLSRLHRGRQKLKAILIRAGIVGSNDARQPTDTKAIRRSTSDAASPLAEDE